MNLFDLLSTPSSGTARRFLWTSPGQLEEALEPIRRLPLGSWRWPCEPAWFYAGEDLLAFVNPSSPWSEGPMDRFEIIVAGRTAEAVAYLRTTEAIEWDSGPD